MNLLNMTNQAAEELNLADLTNSDKELLLLIWQMSSHGKEDVIATYDEVISVSGKKDDFMSKSQFYKSINALLRNDILLKIGSERSKTYRLSFLNT